MSESFAFMVDEQPDKIVLHAHGDIDLSSSQEFAELLRRARQSRKPVVVDLQRVTYFDSVGINVLAEHAEGEPLTIVPSPMVRRVLNLVPLGDNVRVV